LTPSDRTLFGTRSIDSKRGGTRGGRRGGEDLRTIRERDTLPMPVMTENAWKISKPKTRDEQLERQVRSLLNKIAPENLSTIAQKMGDIELASAGEMQHVIRIIFGKALEEPHYCQTYADMIVILQQRYPQFPGETEDAKPETLLRIVLNTAQDEYEQLPKSIVPTAEQVTKFAGDSQGLNQEMGRQKKRLLANMLFIGNLYLRQILASSIVAAVVGELVFKPQEPEELHVDCAVELIRSIGHTLEQEDKGRGRTLVGHFVARLKELRSRELYSKVMMQDMIELQGKSWRMKVKREMARTLREVAAAARRPEVEFETVTVGVRPKLVVARQAPTPKAATKAIDLAKVRRCAQYFADDGDADALVSDWKALALSAGEAQQACDELVDQACRGVLTLVADVLCILNGESMVSRANITVACERARDNLDELSEDFPRAPDVLEDIELSL